MKKSILRRIPHPLLKGLGLVLLFVLLLVLPSLARTVYYYRRPYVPAAVPRPDHAAVDLPTVGVAPFGDEDVQRGEGRVVIDRAHENTVGDAELNVLLSHLTARGIEIVSADAAHTETWGADVGLTPSDDSGYGFWSDMLRAASALVVVSPHQPFSAQEQEAVERFVEQGGRVLLMGDPSRFSWSQVADAESPYDDVYGETSVPESDVAALNSLASPFGLAFADDYLYNTAENAGNYQYVILRDFAQSPLTADLKEVVFYAAHSIAADQETLITADSRTTSSLSERRGGLATVSLGGDGRVLAVADFTFMTEPYNSTADNNRLIGHIADFLASATRTFGLSDFPHFFSDRVDLAYLADPSGEAALPAEVVEQVSRLRAAFEATGKRLEWHVQPSAGRDALYVGLYAGLRSRPEIGEILASQGISFTLETAERALATPTPGHGDALPRHTPTPAPEEGAEATPTPTLTPLRDWIHVPGLGPVDAKESALFYQNEEGGRQVLIALTFSQEGLAAAVGRLVSGDDADCLLDEDRREDPRHIGLALCPTAYQPAEAVPTPTSEEGADELHPIEITPVPVAGGDILIVSDDDGEGVYEWWTSAYDFADIATEAGYVVVLWSTALDGQVTLEQMQSYRAVIWCTGDYQEEGSVPEEDDFSTLLAYLDGGGRLILGGAFIGGAGQGERGLLLDLQVVQAGHPLAEGFEGGQVVVLERFAAEEDYATTLLTETDPQAIVFSRGPASEFAGAAAITVEEDAGSGSKTVWIGLPIYLLPYEDEGRLATNAIRWLLE